MTRDRLEKCDSWVRRKNESPPDKGYDALRTQPYRILVAEDNRAFAKALRFNLEAAGFSTTIADDGSQALQLAQQDQFDLLIADYQMPGILGIDLCRRLRQDERYARTPMILISAFQDCSVVELIEDIELLDAIFVKPFSMEELMSQIRTSLPDSKVATDSPS